MKIEIALRIDARGRPWLRTGPGVPWREAMSVRRAGRRLGRTRRQIYRYIRSGLLRPRAKLLGEWLLDSREVESLARRPAKAQPLPRGLQFLFPEYKVCELNAGRDSTVVLSRVLERGGCRELRWAMRRYRAAEFRGFLRRDGARLLSQRSLAFWRRYFRLPAASAPERRLGRLYGGAG